MLEQLLGDLLYGARKKLDMCQHTVAKKARVKRRRLSRFELGKGSPTAGEAKRLARVLGLGPDRLALAAPGRSKRTRARRTTGLSLAVPPVAEHADLSEAVAAATITKLARARGGMSQREIARLLDCSEGKVARVEREAMAKVKLGLGQNGGAFSPELDKECT